MAQVNQVADLLQQARSGNLSAIRQLMIQTFQDQGIRVQISQNANELKIFLEIFSSVAYATSNAQRLIF
jgi:hypothetical protein